MKIPESQKPPGAEVAPPSRSVQKTEQKIQDIARRQLQAAPDAMKTRIGDKKVDVSEYPGPSQAVDKLRAELSKKHP